MREDVYVTPPLKLDAPRLDVVLAPSGHLVLAQPLELGGDDLLRVGFTQEGRIVGVWVEEGPPA